MSTIFSHTCTDRNSFGTEFGNLTPLLPYDLTHGCKQLDHFKGKNFKEIIGT